MKKIALLFLVTINLFAQDESGTLQRINFDANIISDQDTIGYWYASKNGSSYYENVFTYNNKLYSTKYQNEPTQQGSLNYYYQTFLCNLIEKTCDTIVHKTLVPEDEVQPYGQVSTRIERADTNLLLINNHACSLHLLKGGKLIDLSNIDPIRQIMHVAGKIGNKYLFATKNLSNYHLNYFLRDIDSQLPFQGDEEVTFDISTRIDAPYKVASLNDTLFLIEQEWESSGHPLHIVKFNKNIFSGADTIRVGYGYGYGNWIMKDHELYYSDFYNLYKRRFDETTLTFLKPEKLFTNFQCERIDIDENFMFSRFHDTLKVFSVKQQAIIFKMYLDASYYYLPFIFPDPPYVYLHKQTIKTKTGTDPLLPQEFSLSQNFPNPFNPSTTIKFSIPKVETRHGASLHISLKIYDLLGREVATLVNEEKASGNYEVHFNAETLHGASLPSGVYFYRLQAGNPSQGSGQGFVAARKMIYLK